MADFGQNRLWPNRLWPKPSLAKPTLAKLSFDLCFLCVFCVGVGFPWTALPLNRPSAGQPKILLFFSPLPPFRSLCVSLGVFSLILVFLARLGSRAKNSKRAHFRTPALQTPPEFHEKTPRETQKERILWREREKKNKILGTLRAPTLRAPTLPPPFGPSPFGPPLGLAPGFCIKETKTIINHKKKNNCFKSKQLISNILNFNFGHSRFGQNRLWPN